MKNLSRRQFVGALAAMPLAQSFPTLRAHAEPPANATALADARTRTEIAAYLERHRKPGGGYGWLSRNDAHVTPTFAVAGCYRLLGLPLPEPDAVATFTATHYPVLLKLGQQPLCRLDYEQAQILLWLGRKPDTARAEKWTKPFVYSAYYEQGHNPTLQHQAMAVRVRSLLGLQSKDELPAWREYFLARRRSNGSFNNTPASDGSDGHLVNTLWASDALDDLHNPEAPQALPAEGVEWVRHCQLPSGGFTWSPTPTLGGVDNVIYTWAAISLLQRAGATPTDKAACVRWLREQFVAEGGFRDRPGAKANLTATYYALDALRMLGASLHHEAHRAPALARTHLPSGLRIYSAQIEAPGNGSPTEAIALAEALGIHIWTAKNSPPGWIAEAQRIADARGTGVQVARGDEEYGTYTRVAGFGAYSHLDDLVAPRTADLGPYPPQKNVAQDWTVFRDTRIRQVRQAHGRMVWQFNEDEELTRILLDQTVADRSYGAISGFHFGVGDFLELEPFLMAWEGRIPMVGLQDAHGSQSWWWTPQLEGFRTLYLAHEPGWDGFVKAMDSQWMLAVRQDANTRDDLNQTQWTGALPAVRELIAARESEWSWWGANAQNRAQPLAMLTVLRPGMKFEEGVPTQGLAVRLRLRFAVEGSPTRSLQGAPQSELVSLHIDGKPVQPRSVVMPHDRYLIYEVPDAHPQQAIAVVRDLASQQEQTLTESLR